MAHLPLVPSIKLDYANIKSSQFEWFRSKDTSIWERIAHASDWCYAPMYVFYIIFALVQNEEYVE